MPEEFPLSAVTIMVIVGQGDARKGCSRLDFKSDPSELTYQNGRAGNAASVSGPAKSRAGNVLWPPPAIYRHSGSFATRS